MTTSVASDTAQTLRLARMLVGGQWVESVDGQTLDVENPANRRPIARTPRASAPDVDRAVKAAQTAFESWRMVVPRDRGRLLLRIAEETGNTLRTEARLSADIFRYFGGLANEDWVVDGIVAAMRFTRQSQSCTAGSRLFLHASIFDSFLERLAAKVSTPRLGDPLDEASDIGTLINEKQFKRVCSYEDNGLQQADARLVLGGLPPKDGPLSEVYFALPTVFADVSNDWRIAREEIFGPVLVAIRWTDEQEVIRMACWTASPSARTSR